MSLPERLDEIVRTFRSAPKSLRLQLLLEYGNKVPPLPARFREHPDKLEQVPECQTPLFLAAERTGDGRVELHFDAPPEAPTTRGFAGILSQGLDGLPTSAIAQVPDDFYLDMGLQELISPLRLRGMAGMLSRLKRQVAEQDREG